MVFLPRPRIARERGIRASRLGLSAWLSLGAILAAAPLDAQSRAPAAFVGVNLVEIETGRVVPDQTVVVRSRRIEAVGRSAEVQVPTDVRRIEAAGRYLMPGLIEPDGEVPPPGHANAAVDALIHYLARGVTTVRLPGRDSSLLQLQGPIEAGSLVAPRLLLDVERAAGRPPPSRVLESLVTHEPIPSEPRAPDATLRALTVDAARRLGLGDEASARVEVGARADLLLLEADPLEDPDNLRRIAGVMADGWWLSRDSLVELAESRARGLVRDYYREMRTVSLPGDMESRGVLQENPPRTRAMPARCEGVSFQECFGGDPDCVRMGQRPLHLCTDSAVIEERGRVLARLTLLTNATGGDWLTGQTVSFALKHGEVEHAVALADACGGTLWWCQALRGLARHERSSGSGEAHFDSALASAPPGTLAWEEPAAEGAGDRGLHCEWTDLGYLVPEPLRSDPDRLPCSEEGAFEKRYWWLSDPLWSTPGNERRSEHIARNVQMRLRDQLLRVRDGSYHAHVRSSRRSIYDTPKGEDNDAGHSVVIPFGLPNSWRGVSWTRVGGSGSVVSIDATGRGQELRRTDNRVIQHHQGRQLRHGYVHGGYSFTPDSLRFYEPLASTAEDWSMRWNEGHERTVTAEEWFGLEHHQTALLRRGDSLRVLAAARLPVLLPSLDGVRSALAMGRPADLDVQVAEAVVEPGGTVRASLDLEDGGWMASIEVLGEDFRGRARYGTPTPPFADGFGMSDPVLVDRRFEPGIPLVEAMLPTTAPPDPSSVGVVFEVYGASEEEELTLSVRLESIRVERSFLGRLARMLRLVPSDDGGPTLEWTEPAGRGEGPGISTHHVSLDLSNLVDGEYRLVVQAERSAGGVARATREMTIERR